MKTEYVGLHSSKNIGGQQMKKHLYFFSVFLLVIFAIGCSRDTTNENENKNEKGEDLKVHFLGTAAAEGFPNPFCLCDACVAARELGGKDIRTRSSVVIDDVLKVDFPPDFFHHATEQDTSFTNIKDLLITHSHHDHFNPWNLTHRSIESAEGLDHPLNIYGNQRVVNRSKSTVSGESIDERYTFEIVEPYEELEIETATITPLLADHDSREMCLLYFIERKGKKILYGYDTGWFPDETWDWLKGKGLDLAILDSTDGYNNNKRSSNHMSVETVIEVQKKFKEENIIAEDGIIVASHFSHNSNMTHKELVEAYEPYGIVVAYDGMIIEL